MDSMIARLRVFLPDLLDNYVYLQILFSFNLAPLRAIVINMQNRQTDILVPSHRNAQAL